VPNPPITAFVDDPAIDGEFALLRLINPSWWRRNEGALLKDQHGLPTVTSQAFQLQKLERAQELGYPGQCMSFTQQAPRLGLSGGILSAVDARPDCGLGRITAQILRRHDFGLQVVPEDHDPWHTVAFPLGTLNPRNAQSPLAQACLVVHVPEVIQLELAQSDG